MIGRAALVFGLMATLAVAQDDVTTYRSKPGRDTLVKVEGTSTVHDWTVEGRIVAGQIEFGPGFSTDPTKLKPGKLEAKAKIDIPVRALKSMKNGQPYSNAMDGIMYENLKESEHKRISYTLSELSIKEVPQGAGEPILLTSKGELEVAGVKKEIEMPVKVTPMDKGALKFSMETAVKMTDFGIQPPAPKIALGAIKTGDEVKIIIDWVTVERKKKK